MDAPRIDDGLNSDHAVAIHHTLAASRVMDQPASAQQLYGVRTAVFNTDMVAKRIVVCSRIRLVSEIYRLYTDGNAIGGLHLHGVKI